MVKYTYNPPYNQWSGNRSDTLNKWKINYKGSIATASALPDKGEFKGDTYNVLEDGSNYMWNGTSWDKLDANVYVGSTATTSGVRGLVPPATTAQMYSLLTGSGVWKSGVELGFAYDNITVHLTGDETVQGVKTFQNTASGHGAGDTVTDLVIRNPEVERGIPVEGGRSFTRFILADAEGDIEETYIGRLGLLEVMSPMENDTSGEHLRLACYKYDYDPADPGKFAAFEVGYDLDGVRYATAPATSDDRNNSTDIVTRGWANSKIADCVDLTTNQSIGGVKTFTDQIVLNTASSSFQKGVISSQSNGVRLSSEAFSVSSSGAYLDLNGRSASSSAGSFGLGANSSAGSKLLQGKPDGTLTWNGQTIQTTSDERLKTSLSEVPDAVLDAWEEVNWGQFQYLDAVKEKGESARLHLGLIAQHVISVFEKHGLDACDYGILCHEEREATEDSEAVDLWMVRYAEAQAMEAACQRRKAERAEARIKSLEDRLEALEAKLA